MNPFTFKNGIWKFKCPEGRKMSCYSKENCGAILMWNGGYFSLFQKRLHWGIIYMQKSASIFKSMVWCGLTKVYIHVATIQSTEKTSSSPKSSSGPHCCWFFSCFLLGIYFNFVKHNTDKIIQRSSVPLCIQFTRPPARGHWYAFCHYRLVLPTLEHHVSGVRFCFEYQQFIIYWWVKCHHMDTA